MPSLDVSELNIIIAVLGGFILLYGFISVKIKNVWYLGEALPAMVVGICLGPLAAKFIDAQRWGSAEEEQEYDITLGICRIVIGVQLVIAGFQLPAKYQMMKWKEMALALLPIMTTMWLCTTGCILAVIPKLSLLSALVIGSCVTCTDPILSQALAKGPFADKFVARPLREIISSEAGANDGFGFPFLMLATYLMRYASGYEDSELEERSLFPRSEEEVGRLGGGVGKALETWVVETWLYVVLMSVAYGAVLGFISRIAIKFSLKRKWIDSESYVLWPTALGLFIIGTCGQLGTDDLLACFVAGSALNWDNEYLEETLERHDEVNASIDVLLNFGGFMYIGSILPWDDFNQPDTTGITYARLFGLGFLVLMLRRLPAILAMYRFMPSVVKTWKEALFMGYFGPIGIGAVFYLEHTRHLFPELGEGDEEMTNLIAALPGVVYWLVFFSIVVHGLSIPGLNIAYKYAGIAPIQDDAREMRRLSISRSQPKNSIVDPKRDTIIAFNRFSRPSFPEGIELRTIPSNSSLPRSVSVSRPAWSRKNSFAVMGAAAPSFPPNAATINERSNDDDYALSICDEKHGSICQRENSTAGRKGRRSETTVQWDTEKANRLSGKRTSRGPTDDMV